MFYQSAWAARVFSLVSLYHICILLPSSAVSRRISPVFLVTVCTSNIYSSYLWPISSPVMLKSSFFSAQICVSFYAWLSSHFLHSPPSCFCFSVFLKPAFSPEELWCLRDLHRKGKIPLILSASFLLVCTCSSDLWSYHSIDLLVPWTGGTNGQLCWVGKWCMAQTSGAEIDSRMCLLVHVKNKFEKLIFG